MADERRRAILAAVAESNARLGTLTEHVCFKYGSQDVKGGAGGCLRTIVFPPHTGEALTYVRYMAIELDDFAGMYMRNRGEIIGGLDGGEASALHSLVGGQADSARLVRDIRGELGDGRGLTLGELGSSVSPARLEQILLYALLVAEFQWRLAGGSLGDGLARREWEGILDVPKPRSIDQAYDLRDALARGFPDIDMGRHLRACSIMHERREGMMMLRKILDGSLVEFERDPSCKTIRLTWASCMLKYMVMDLAEFALWHETLGLETRTGFALNRKMYVDIYDRYFAGNSEGEGAGVARLVRDERGVLTSVLNDTEADIFMSQIRPVFARAYAMPNGPHYSPDLAGISQRLEQARARADAGGAGLGAGEAADAIAGVFGQTAW